MYQINIYGCDNSYETSPIKCLWQRYSTEPNSYDNILRDYRNALKERAITVLHIVIQKVDTENGTIEIILNEVGRVEPRKRTVVNPAAQAVIQAKKAQKKVAMGDIFQTIA